MIYLDNHATTMCDPRVVEAMLPYFSSAYGNPGSPHAFGQLAANAVATAREQVAHLVGALPEELIFTSGATEANNLAILGAAFQHERVGGRRRRLVTCAIEHKSVLEPCEYLASLGWDVVLLPVNAQGTIQWEQAERLVNEDTLLVSLQAANSEVGTIQDVRRMASLAHQHGALLHCDAAQAVGKVAVDVEAWQVDLLSLSAHKLYGPKGVGALFVRGGRPSLPLAPLMLGGSQEYGLRPGTVPVPLVVGMGAACLLAEKELTSEMSRLQELRDELEDRLLTALPAATINGDQRQRLPHNSSLTFPGVEAEALLANVPTVALSMGAACESGSLDPSRVLLTMGLSHEDAFCTVRIGLGRFTTLADIDVACQEISEAVQLLTDPFF
jgi:cysteine desulfurase